ncbi:alpha/beta fold hydrolase [Antrihabitans cavernicola]|uniref:Alpha/beta hydrolase n=1 Tax=Antrihabitans cavernicola TaxID=2495913 RepID=A0A5A7SJF4_9NOCA|nr:alpha/beta hydrolase [Spelaeibacter cavernicola]KAA0024565.1 alpha/beta hydrolase [Spelaeibacter cavernicola]
MFENFTEFDVEVSNATIHGRRGGDGPPLLLLHGIPETHLMWHRIASELAEHFTVIAADLRGFGDSSAPADADYSMRALALDQREMMSALGFDRFGVVGHDRGARCAYRLALDHPDAVTSLAVLDIVPTAHAFRHADKAFALGFWVWSFLAAPYPVPERLVANDPSAFVDYMLDDWSSAAEFPDDVREVYRRQFADPQRVHAICQQYRAAATVDIEHDDADHGLPKIACPTLVLWSADGPLGKWYDPLAVWGEWADDVRGGAVPGGHFLPEEAPDEVVRALREFLLARSTT